jgi:hypothetical protein
MTPSSGIRILVDADACPVKQEIYRVAERENVRVTLVSNSGMRVPPLSLIDQHVVNDSFDAADDLIVETVATTIALGERCMVITTDILLADRCLKSGARVLAPNGKLFTSGSIGPAIATRAIMADLRAGGAQIGGPRPFSSADRSAFLQALDRELVAMKRAGTPTIF